MLPLAVWKGDLIPRKSKAQAAAGEAANRCDAACKSEPMFIFLSLAAVCLFFPAAVFPEAAAAIC